ncbi:MAG TPA: hypothetical protein VGM90_10885 [Kofleriaceae bacterium]|jgi:tetratricopeptide (TPR) repeat protein
MRGALFVIALAVCAAPSLAHADTQPWSVGVSEAQKATAQKLLEAGNALFLERNYVDALEKYKAAVAAWDHPAIRFNLVRCYVQLGKNVDAAQNLELALKYGNAPLEENVYTEALAYQKLLGGRIATIEATCAQEGVKLTLDGQALAECPATKTTQLEPGTHQLVGVKQGYLTRTLEVFAFGGKSQSVTVALEPLTTAARIEHRWPQWLPWVVFGGGLAVAGIGGLVDLNAAGKADDYDRAVAQKCPMSACNPAVLGSDADLKNQAETRRNIAYGLFAAGGAITIGGAVMLYMNRGRTVYPESVEKVTPSVAPMPGGAALSFSGRF